MCLSKNASQTLLRIHITRGPYLNGDYDSGGLGWGLRLCAPDRFPGGTSVADLRHACGAGRFGAWQSTQSVLQWCCCLGLESLARQAGSRIEVWGPFGLLGQT